MQPTDIAGQAAEPNHPQANRMGGIAWTAHNVIIGSIFGTAGVLLIPMQEHLHVSREMASLGTPMVMIGSAVLGSVAGVLAGRFSLRLLLAVVSVLMAAAWVMLATTSSYAFYLIAYGVFLGPAMAVGGSVLPPTLITRWFNQHRGLAIGLSHLPVVITIMPLAAQYSIDHYGLQTTFLLLGAFAAVTLLPAAWLLIDHPPMQAEQERAQGVVSHARTSDGAMSVWQLFANRRFWLLAVAVGAANTSSVVLGTHLVSMGKSWGIDATHAAGLASAMSLVGMGGSIFYGWLSDRIGGAKSLVMILLADAVLWSLMLLQLPYAGLLVVVGLIGMGGAGAVPSLSKAAADNFGAASFSRAFGLAATAVLPIMVGAVYGFGKVFHTFGNYQPAIIGMIVYFIIAVPLALLLARGRKVASAT